MITDFSIQYQWVTNTAFLPCSFYQTYSQANFAFTLYKRFLIFLSLPIASLCYFLKGCHPNKTDFLPLFLFQTFFNNGLSLFVFTPIYYYGLRSSLLKENTVRQIGSSCLVVSTQYLNYDSNFTGFIFETVEYSFSHSYLSTINRLLIALHSHGQVYRGHLVCRNEPAFTYSFKIKPLGRDQFLYFIFLILQKPVFLVNSRYSLFISPSCELTELFCRVP